MLPIAHVLMATLLSAPPTPHRTVAAVLDAPQIVVVHAKDYAFTVPKSVKSGVTTFRLVNDGKELHHVSVVRLQKGKTVADFVAFMKKPAPPFGWFTEVGGPNPALPGGSVDATMNLEPGEYAVVCFIPSPGEQAPHMMKGMVAGFTVTSEKSAGVAPASDVTIRTSDYTFAVSKPFTKGHHVVTVENDATQAHEVVLIQLAPGKTIADAQKWIEVDLMKGTPPGKPIGGMSGIAKGLSASFPIDLVPGNYGLICFMPDMKDNKSHAQHGMMQGFTIQ